MPNKLCYFGCNKFKNLLIFSIPKNKVLRQKWLESLEIDHFSLTGVVCQQHFQNNQIKRLNDIFNSLGNLVCSVSTILKFFIEFPKRCSNICKYSGIFIIYD